MANSFTNLKNILEKKFETNVYDFSESFGMIVFYVNKNFSLKVLTFLYDDEDLKFQYLTDLTAAHFPDNKDEELEVVYHLQNLKTKERVRMKVKLPISNPEIFTATNLFSGANWMERETYDFFGVIFKNHPNLKRILNVEEMDYFPMRKEYGLEDKTRLDKDDEMFGRVSNNA